MSTVETAPETAPDADGDGPQRRRRYRLRARAADAALAVWRSLPVRFVRADVAGHRECQALGRRRATWAAAWLWWRVGVPVLVMVVQQPGWSRGWHALTNRMVTWRKQLGSAAVVTALIWLFGIAPLVLTVAAPALVPLSFGAGRVIYPLVPRGRARTRYEPDGWLTYPDLREEMSADAVRRTALYTRPSVKAATTRPGMTKPSELLLRRMPVSECGTWLGNTAIGTTFRSPCYASLEAAVGLIAPPRKWKALALDTPIATPSGWTTMGEIAVGDQVFDRDGKVCSVTGTSEVFHDRPCYDVTTNDGEVITADADHLWVARLDKNGREGVHTTETIARSRRKKASISTAPALDLPEVDLPVDPYLLGVWLGDGSSSSARIYTADQEVVDRIAAAGYTTRKTTQPFEWHPFEWHIGRAEEREAAVALASELVGQGYSGRQARQQAGLVRGARLPVSTPRRGRDTGPVARSVAAPVRSVQEDLRALGVLGNKHVPARYFRGSAVQRLALLQGLVDSDGGVEPTGQVSYCSTSYQLARDVRELVFSLGVKASIRSREAQLDGRACGTEYRVRFFMRDAAALPRKAERCRDASEARRDRYVTATPTTSVLTRCIAVDSPTRTYLAGRSLLPTHNTALMGHHICDSPGAVLSTQTKPETYFMTRAVRQKKSRSGHGVMVLDPEGLTGDVSLRFSPVTGSRDPKFAQLMGSMLAAAADGPGEDREWFAAQCATALQFFLLVADISGRSMVDVYRWAQGAAPAMEAIKLASKHPTEVPPGWAVAMRAVMETEATRTRDAIMMTLAGAVGFMGDQAVAEVCSAPTDEHPAFDVASFIADRGSVYLIASDRKHNKVAPLLAAFTGWLFETAKDLAVINTSRHDAPRRLDPPLTLVLDEIANTIPLPLDLWIADSGGRGIRIIWSVQSRSQLRTRWGADAADTIWNATTTKLMAGGSSVEADLQGFSDLCGTRTVYTADGTAREVPVMSPSDVRRIPRWHAALLHDTSDVTLVRIWPVWMRPDVLTAKWTPKRPAIAPVIDQTDVEQALAEIEAAVQPEPADAATSGGR